MELKDFVKESLVQIAEGVTSAMEEYSKMGGVVNPGAVKDAGNLPYIKVNSMGSQILISTVEFEVVLSEAETEEVDGQAKARLCVFSLGAGKNISGSHAQLSTVKFSVPVVLPRHKASNVQKSV